MDHAPKVVALGFGSADYADILRETLPKDFELELADPDAPDLNDVLSDANFLLVTWCQVPRDVIAAARNVALIQTTVVGVNHIDLAAAREFGLPVANAAGGNAVAVAEHALLLMLAVYRRLVEGHQAVEAITWPQSALYSAGMYELTGKTVGLVGFGNIGQTVARLLTGFDARVLYYRRHRLPVSQETALRVTYRTLDDLLASSDVVSLHIPLTPETTGLIGQRELDLMKPSAILVNTARGGVVDEPALIDALENERLAGAGLDVLTAEPIEPNHPLLGLDNVVLTPHVGGVSAEASRFSIALSCENIRRVAQGQAPVNVVA
jgi:phosphoglycerate dehydrogenase-like enzyme